MRIQLITVVAFAIVLGPHAPRSHGSQSAVDFGLEAGELFLGTPHVITLVELGPEYDSATVSDLELADFDGDGVTDIAVAWYATDLQDRWADQRRLAIYRGLRPNFELVVEFDLYVPDPTVAAMSIFRNGTSELCVGDFDGDGDADLVAHAFFGDEMWVFENLGGWTFDQQLKFPFQYNTPGNFITPPESLAGDLDGDGRDELVYITDPVLQMDGRIIHIWRTVDTISNLYLTDWEGGDLSLFTQWARGLAVADFDGDGRDDLCFSGTMQPPQEEGPVVTLWYDLDVTTGWFSVQREFPALLCSDVADVQPQDAARPGLVLTDLGGTTMQYWSNSDGGTPDFTLLAEVGGYAGLSPNRGMTALPVDLDDDGDADLVTKQKLGEITDGNQIELTLCDDSGAGWTHVDPPPLSTLGFRNDPFNQILRPRNLGAADLGGNRLCDVAAGFAATPQAERRSEPGDSYVQIAIWGNGCLGDANRDGRTDQLDVHVVAQALRSCAGDPEFVPDADLNRDGCITAHDLVAVAHDLHCVCRPDVPVACPGQLLGDANCDGELNTFDVDAFSLALVSEAEWSELYGDAGCSYECVSDIEGDGHVDVFDIDIFVELVTFGGYFD